MASGGDRGTGTLAVFGVAVLVNLVLSILLLDQIGRTREEVARLREVLATKQDVAMLKPVRVDEILEERCERCHTTRRFAALADMSSSEVLTTIQRMRTHPGADIPADEVREIEAALLVFRCTTCHDEAVLSQMALMPSEERIRFLRAKVAMPSSGFRPDQVGELIDAFQVLLSRAQ
jgi:hypothetical protein